MEITDSLEQALGIPPARFNAISWAIDDMFVEQLTKADAIKKIAGMKNLTEEERVWAGYILCRKHVSLLGLPGKVVLRSL
jgi:hypothetical protein